MLVLTRKEGESVFLTTQGGERIEVVVKLIRGKQVRLGFICGPSVLINREADYVGKAEAEEETAG